MPTLLGFGSMGSHSLTASYAGDANNAASSSAALNLSVAKALSATSLSTSPASAAPSQSVTLTATVTGYGTLGGTVTFYDGSTPIASGVAVTNGQASLATSFANTGSHPLTAVYGGDANNEASASLITALGITSQATVYYIQPDQLGTPRSITNTNANLVWQWDNIDPFGNNAPNENPSSLGTFQFNLRFPGQYYDPETGLAYNVNRDYDASIGRYIESDPIGLYGGVNTYTYVGGNPLSYIDPEGLDPLSICMGSMPSEQSPAAQSSTIQCDGNGNYEVVNNNSDCDAKCTDEHEKSHIDDWKKRYGSDSCKNRPKGYLPLGGNGYSEFLRQSECKAYKIGKACRQKLPSSCHASAGIQRDDNHLLDLRCK